MKQKLNFILTFIFLISSLSLMAQRPNMPSPEDIKAWKAKFLSDKVAYLTTRIDLTPDEAEKFWPVYNEFDEKLVDIQGARYSMKLRVMRSREPLTDDEITKFIRDYNNSKLEEEQLNVKYYEKFLKILPPKKVFALYRAEEDYVNYLNMRRGGNHNNFNR